MMLSEFVERTGFEPMPAEYAKIEEAYCSFNGDKDAFCKAFVAGCQRRCDFVVFCRTENVDKWRVKVYSLCIIILAVFVRQA